MRCDMTVKGTLIVVTAPSGAGKTTLVHELVNQVDDLMISVSHTTRAPRAAEVAGKSYHFVSQSDFFDRIEKGLFLEHALVYGNYYGTCAAWVHEQLSAGTDVVLEIDWQGALAIQKKMPDCVTVFILPPSVQALADRLGRRAQDSDVVVEARLAAATEDISKYQHFDYLVLNEEFDQALAHLRAIVLASRSQRQRAEKRLAPVLESLL